MFVIGVDIGSLATKAVLLDENREIIGYSILLTGADSSKAGQAIIEKLMRDRGIGSKDIAYILSTGYGRENISISNGQLTEITCHARGAVSTDPEVRTVIDIGGQDSKAISMNGDGDVIKFAMNDKCAAGTGRFLEVMARALEIDLQDMGELSLKSKLKVEVSSMCTVFAETEVISLISRSVDKIDIIAAIHRAIASRTGNMVENVGVKPKVMMTGGVAKNIGVVHALEERLGCKILVPQEPQIVGALGAAMFALDRATSEDVKGNAA